MQIVGVIITDNNYHGAINTDILLSSFTNEHYLDMTRV